METGNRKIVKNKSNYYQYILLIVFIGFLVYARSLTNDFVWDDEEMIVKNFPYFTLGNLPNLFTQATFFSGGLSLSGWFYRPLVMSSFLLIKTVFGESSSGFHFIQITLHLINGALVFLVFEKIFNKFTKKSYKKLSLLLAMIFTTHPAHVESVAYIASISEPIYLFFILILTYMLISWPKVFHQKWNRWTIFILFLSALLTKEGAVVFLPVLLFYLFLFSKKYIKTWGAWLTSSLITYLFIRLVFFGLQSKAPNFLNPIGQATLVERIKTLPLILSRFATTFVVPLKLSVSQHMVVKQFGWSSLWLPLIGVLLMVIGLGIYLVKSKNKLAIFFSFWVIVSIIPVSNLFFPLDMSFAERWLYIPMVGMLGLTGSILIKLSSWVKYKKYLFAFLAFVVMLFSARTIIRTGDWKNGYTLYAHDIEINPESYDLQNNLGVEMFRKGEKNKSIKYFSKSIELQPNWTISNNNLGAAYEYQKDLDNAEKYYKKSVELGNYYLAYENYAMLLIKKNKLNEAREFLENEAFPRFPNNPRLIQAYLYIQEQD